MSCRFDHCLGVLAFVKCSIVHHKHRTGRQLWDQVILKPEVEHVSIDVGRGQPHGEQRACKKRSDGVDPALGVPIPLADATLTLGRVAVQAGHIRRKAAFVDIDDGPILPLIAFNLLAEDVPSVVVRPGMTLGFFCVSRPDDAMPEKLHSGKLQNARRVHANTRPDTGVHLRPKRPYRSCACVALTDPAPAV